MKTAPQCVRNNLGLVCITTTPDVRYRTVTRKTLLSLSQPERKEKLRDIYTQNIGRLERAIRYCAENRINLYRMTSGLFPFADENPGAEILSEFADRLAAAGRDAIKKNIRLVLHPDQYVVLSSDSEKVIANSIKILKLHARTMDLLGQPESEWATMTIHGGKSDRADRLVETIRDLPANIRKRIGLENDEHAYSSAEILEVCRRAGTPMVFDAHHHICREKLEDFDHPSIAEYFWAARETWENPENQLVHISNGRQGVNDRAHSDLIFTMPEVYRHAPWIEVEAKHKEMAIEKLKTEWLNA